MKIAINMCKYEPCNADVKFRVVYANEVWFSSSIFHPKVIRSMKKIMPSEELRFQKFLPPTNRRESVL
jgi:hypothetical protein